MAQEEKNEAQPDQEMEELLKVLETPISPEDAKKEFADIDVLKAQLRVARQRTMYEITQMQLKLNAIDEQLLAADMRSAVTYRRALNRVPAPEAQKQ